MFKRIIVLAGLVMLLVWGCGGDSPTGGGGGDEELKPLAGGGRLDAKDPFSGHHGADSGGMPHIMPPDLPTWPDSFGSDWSVLFYSEVDCAKDPGEQIISDTAAWRAWWDDAHSCFHYRDSSMMPPKITGDSSWTDTIPPGGHGNPWEWHGEAGPPEVDFDQFIVAAIRVEYDSGSFCMRNVNVTQAGVDDGEFVIHYEVSRLNGTCCDMIMAPMIAGGGSPTVAVMLEKPTAPARFERSNGEFSCWMPDPDDPLTLYYTNTECDLGPDQQLITDDAAWTDWWTAARSCDMAIWEDIFPDSLLGVIDPIDPNGAMWVVPMWDRPEVDFSRYAVIILRGDPQTHWGGGVWLTDYIAGTTGSTVEYTVMEATEACPPVDPETGAVEPTVAIRVLRPANDQVTWRKTTREIDCEWTVDSTLAWPM